MKMLTLFNRRNKPFRYQRNGIEYIIKPHSEVTLPEPHARHALKRAIELEDFETGERVFKLGIEGGVNWPEESTAELENLKRRYPCDPLDAVPEPVELIDRTNEPTRYSKEGTPLKPVQVNVAANRAFAPKEEATEKKAPPAEAPSPGPPGRGGAS
ncbi:MAG: hypothetical protein ACE5JL_10885, partial [Dehalococcoidia bacterium]